jgi:uncharacterized protein YlxP (DUF503 family)
MVVAVLKVVLSIPHAASLKDKRRVLKSVKDKLRNRFNVSVAEIGDQDIWQTAQLGIAIVSNDSSYANGVISRVQDLCKNLRDAIMTDCILEWR